MCSQTLKALVGAVEGRLLRVAGVVNCVHCVPIMLFKRLARASSAVNSDDKWTRDLQVAIQWRKNIYIPYIV